jgi:D-alanyl-D-alanine carboxypeptidase
MSEDQVDQHGPGISRTSVYRSSVRHSVAAGLAGTLAAGVVLTASVFTAVSPAHARVPAAPHTSSAVAILTPRGAHGQVTTADGPSASLVRSDAAVTVARSRLATLTVQARPLLASFRATRKAQVASQTEATAQSARLVELGRQVQLAQSALQQSAINSYIGGGGPLGEMAVALESLTAPPPNHLTGSLGTMNYRVNLRAQLLNQAKSAQLAQATTSSRATSASNTATAAATSSAQAKSAHDSIITRQQRLYDELLATDNIQVSRAAGARGTLIRSDTPAARAADRHLARVLNGRDYRLLMSQSTSCGKGSPVYSNGWWPSSALCNLYAAPGQSLRRSAAMAFNRMSNAYQEQTGSALCVNESYRSYPAQVAIKASLPGLAATPGTSKHGLGLAVDLCGGVQDFANPTHLWLDRNASRFGWFHPAWAEPSGALPEPWHWEFAG